MADLATCSDTELDATLQRLYGEHKGGDKITQAEVHAQIVAVLGEQAARLDGWLDQALGLG